MRLNSKISIRTVLIATAIFGVVLALGFSPTTYRLHHSFDMGMIMQEGDLVDVIGSFGDRGHGRILSGVMVEENITDDGRQGKGMFGTPCTLVLRVNQFQKIRLGFYDNLKFVYPCSD